MLYGVGTGIEERVDGFEASWEFVSGIGGASKTGRRVLIIGIILEVLQNKDILRHSVGSVRGFIDDSDAFMCRWQR